MVNKIQTRAARWLEELAKQHLDRAALRKACADRGLSQWTTDRYLERLAKCGLIQADAEPPAVDLDSTRPEIHPAPKPSQKKARDKA